MERLNHTTSAGRSTTTRHADGSPMQHGADVSQLIYAVVNSSG